MTFTDGNLFGCEAELLFVSVESFFSVKRLPLSFPC